MKIKLLFAFLICSFGIQAQTPINEYYGHLDGSLGNDGNSHRSYYFLTSAVPLDQSATGPNAVWNFDQLSYAGSSIYDNAAPTASESIAYPNTTIVTTNTTTVGTMNTVSQAYFTTTGATAFTGVQSTDLSLSYTNNGSVGTFPLTYGYTNTDAISGNYTYTTYSGTFTGTITSTVDGYGTLLENDFGIGGIQTNAVTRLKVVQFLNLTYIIPNAGTATITNYHYYRNNDNFPFFTSTDTSIDVPLLSINQTATALESAFPFLLNTPSFSLDNQIVIAPNPVLDMLWVQSTNNVIVRSIEITDVNGRIAGQSNENSFNISKLSKGIYFVKVVTDAGTVMKKIIKE